MSTVKLFGAVLLVTLVFAAVFPAAPVSAQMEMMLDLPPGIAKQAQPILEQMMQHMQQMGMSEAEMQMMMADMQTMVDQLPPGIFLQLLKLMVKLDMPEMMQLHMQIHQGDLLQQPPGQVLIFVNGLAR
ncbi:MAG TPA: hypothetical protein VF498_13220 [Anaerolineales bacterium]